MKELGVEVHGLLSSSHYAFDTAGEVIGAYGRSIYTSCQKEGGMGGKRVAPVTCTASPDTTAALASCADRTRALPHLPTLSTESTPVHAAVLPAPAPACAQRGSVGNPGQSKRHNMHVPRQRLRRVLFDQLEAGQALLQFTPAPLPMSPLPTPSFLISPFLNVSPDDDPLKDCPLGAQTHQIHRMLCCQRCWWRLRPGGGRGSTF